MDAGDGDNEDAGNLGIMKIILNNKTDDTVILSDDDLDNDAFVDVHVENKDITVSIDELLFACIAFESQRNRRLAREDKS